MSDLIVKSINRGDNFTLAQKRKLKALYNKTQNDIAQVASSVPDPVDLYGGALQYGSVTWISGLTFDVSACGYIIEGVQYTSPPATITLEDADATHPRIDVIYVDVNGEAGYITGVAASDPAKPEIDQNTQLELTHITVFANQTIPENVGASDIYLEGAGDTAEWNATEDTSAARILIDDLTDPYAGTKSILFSDVENGDTLSLTAGSAGRVLTVGDMTALETHIKANSWPNKKEIRVAFFYGAGRVSSWVKIQDGSFGFDRTNTTDYQTVTIPSSAFNFTGSLADSVQFDVNKGGNVMTFNLDNVRAQTGSATIINNILIGLTEEELINNVRTWNAQQPFGNDTLTDAATIAWDLDSSPIAEVTLDGDRTLDISNIRAGGTYVLFVTQDGTTGSRLMTWDAAVQWAGGTAPTLSTTAGAVDMFTFIAKSDTVLLGVSGGLDFS